MRRFRRRSDRQHGQSLVEFSLVLPIFIVLLMGVIEFGLVFNAVLAINFASRDASLTAAEAGNARGSDCVILKKIEDSIGAPATPSRVTEVRIYKAKKDGTSTGVQNVYTRTATPTLDCTAVPSVAVNLPYALATGASYDELTRCNALAGCSGSGGVDTIGVQITYHYNWVTPLGSILGLGISDYTMVKANAMRMEPIL